MEQQNVTLEKKERPGGLTALCILTFIWSGIWTLIALVGIFASGAFIGYFENMLPGGGAMATGIFIAVFAILFILFGLSLFGAIKMFTLKKSGFVMYTIANGLMLLLQLYSIATAFSIGGLIYLLISLLFIILYAQNLKYMS
jgi:hypothetical protein